MKIKVHLRIGKKVQLENGRNMHLQKSNYKMDIPPNVKWKSNLETKIKDHLKIGQKKSIKI